MTDRELLELAAKAAGIDYWIVRFAPRSAPVEKLHITENGETVEWNPLVNDALALRLAVKLKLTVGHNFYSTVSGDSVFAKTQSTIGEFEYVKNDPYAATRRAIVRAAAEIGRNMK